MNDLSSRGRPRFYDPDLACTCAEQLINADEPERALALLDNVPAYYREFPTERMREIRRSLHRQLWTPVQYKGIYESAKMTPEMINASWCLRYQLLEAEVKVNPFAHIIELAPGALTVPHGLKHKGYKFTYESFSLDGRYKIDNELTDAATIFCAFEIIEHLSNEWEIYQNYLKFGREADVIMISSPLFTYGGGMDDWRNRPLGHLRTYTPTELATTCARMFQGYQWQMTIDDTIVLVGRR